MRTLINRWFPPLTLPRIPGAYWLDVLLRWQQIARERRLLREMSEHQLRDIGISRAEADREARRPFWEDPRRGWYRL